MLATGVRAGGMILADSAAQGEGPREALAHLPVATFLLDSDGVIQWINATAARLPLIVPVPRGHPWGTVLRRPHGKPWPPLAALAEQSRRQPVPAMLDPDGEVSCTFVVDTIQPTGWVLAVWPDTPQPRIPPQVHASLRLEAMHAVARHIVNNFNNAFTAIRGHLNDILHDQDPAAGIAEALQVTDRASSLVRQLHRLVHPTPIRRRPIDIDHLIRRSVAGGAAELPPSLRIVTTLDHGRAVIDGDAESLTDIIVNVLRNAGDAIGTAPGTITISTHVWNPGDMTTEVPDEFRSRPIVEIAVADDGPGIPADVIPHIFDPLFTTRGNHRSGLGLAGIYDVLKQHGGGLTVESEVDDGTTFRFLLPLSPAAATVDPRSAPMTASAPGTADPLATGTALVIDDEPSVRRIVRKTLERLHYTILEAANGAEGLELFARNREDIQLIILDILMPEMSGWDVLKQLQDHPAPPAVILQSGFVTEWDSAHAGLADAFLRKPYDLHELSDTVRRVMERHRGSAA